MTEALVFRFPIGKPDEINLLGRVDHIRVNQTPHVLQPDPTVRITHEGYDGNYRVHAEHYDPWSGCTRENAWIPKANVEEGQTATFQANGHEYIIYHRRERR